MRRQEGNTTSVTVTVPGNLLLLGEYAVLEEGGLGVTLALERRVVATVEPAAQLEIEGFWGREVVRWSDEDPASSPLFAEVVGACRRFLARPSRPAEHPGTSARGEALREAAGRIRIDSSAFFSSPERKSGFGSSAAVAVALVWSILSLAAPEPDPPLPTVASLALEAHRAHQGGGSGYDVFTSTYGGTGLFTGGAVPRWERRDLPWLPPLYLLRGPRSVSSARAVGRYQQWKSRHPQEARGFLDRSNRCVRGFAEAASWQEAESSFRRSRKEGAWLGEEIGVPAALGVPDSLQGLPHKAIGAGDELGVLTIPGTVPAVLPDSAEPLLPAREGVQWRR